MTQSSGCKAAFAAGLAAQTVQVIALREVLQVARGGEAVLGLALACWLVGSALGALLWRGRAWVAAWLVACLPAAVLLCLRLWPVSRGSWAPAAALLALPAAFAPGAFFAAVLREGRPRGALLWEAAGACAAGALLTFFLLQFLPALVLLLVAAVACLASAGLHWAGGAALLCAALFAAAPVDVATSAARAERLWPGASLEAVAESPYGRLFWLRRDGQRSLFVNGQLALTTPDEVDAEAFVQVVLAAHPDPRRVLVIGPGHAGVLRECLRHGVEDLELALQDRQVLEITRSDLAEADRAALDATRVLIGDPCRIAAGEEHDVVLVLAPEPLTLAANRTYTVQFFLSVRLTPDGFVAFGLPAGANEREGEILARNVSVFRALEQGASLRAVVLPGAVDLFFAGRKAPDISPDTLSTRLRARGVVLKHHAQDFFAEEYAPEEVERVARVYRDYPEPAPPAVPFAVDVARPGTEPPAVLPNSDLHPGAVLHAMAALARKEQVPFLAAARAIAGHTDAILAPLVLIGLIWAWRRGARAATVLAATTTGIASMALWVVLLMAYQARVGALYGDLALLAAAFMAGFAAGTRIRMPLMVADCGFVLLSLGVAWFLSFWSDAAGHTLLALAVGAAGGASLGNAVARFPDVAPRLYAADLMGAALAALLFGTLLLPAVGTVGACTTVGALKIFSLACLMLTRVRPAAR